MSEETKIRQDLKDEEITFYVINNHGEAILKNNMKVLVDIEQVAGGDPKCTITHSKGVFTVKAGETFELNGDLLIVCSIAMAFISLE